MNFYTGLSPFYLRFLVPEWDAAAHKNRYRNLAHSAHGYGMEVHGGFVYKLAKRLSAFSEVAGGIVDIPDFTRRASIYTASFVVGLRVKITQAAAKSRCSSYSSTFAYSPSITFPPFPFRQPLGESAAMRTIFGVNEPSTSTSVCCAPITVWMSL